MILARYPHEGLGLDRRTYGPVRMAPLPREPVPDPGAQDLKLYALHNRIRTALFKLLGCAHPNSSEAAWAAEQLEAHGLDTHLGAARPNAKCPNCPDKFYQHGKTVCHAPGCRCAGREAALRLIKESE